jgi:homogentisate 1,2-dioxygenase
MGHCRWATIRRSGVPTASTPSNFRARHLRRRDTPGVDTIDFVVFPPRWLAMQNTFRPPWFHRNVASEFMGLIHGSYDAKATGFAPGGSSLHNCMSGHGPDSETFDHALRENTSQPRHIGNTMAFMFETRTVIRPTRGALGMPGLQKDYLTCWQGLKKHFDPTRP